MGILAEEQRIRVQHPEGAQHWVKGLASRLPPAPSCAQEPNKMSE